MNQVLAAANAWGIAHVFVWNLYDQSATSDYGAFGIDGLPTALALYYQNLFARVGGPAVTN